MHVVKIVLRQGLILALTGIGVGLAIGLAVARGLASGLVGLATPNVATFLIVPLTLLIVTLAACYVPARRASKIDPILALRCD